MGKKKGKRIEDVIIEEVTSPTFSAAEFGQRLHALAEHMHNHAVQIRAQQEAARVRRERGLRAAMAVSFEALRADGRPTFDALYLAVAQIVGMAADCSRPNGLVGAVAVRDDVPLAWGYVGVAAGAPGCLSGACGRATSTVESGAPYHDCISQHAEVNLIGFAAHHGISLADATIYVSRKPCSGCYKAISAARIVRIVWPGQLTALARA